MLFTMKPEFEKLFCSNPPLARSSEDLVDGSMNVARKVSGNSLVPIVNTSR